MRELISRVRKKKLNYIVLMASRLNLMKAVLDCLFPAESLNLTHVTGAMFTRAAATKRAKNFRHKKRDVIDHK